MTAAIFLPGITVPAHVAFASLLAELGPSVDVVAKELEVYAGAQPPEDYSLSTELDGLHRFATERGYDRFHLYGHSLGGSVALAYTAAYGDRVASLALNEPATDFSDADRAAVAAQHLGDVPEAERMRVFVRQFVRPGVELPPPPAAPPTPEMAKRPAGLAAAIPTTETYRIDHTALARFSGPVYFSYGTLSNARWEDMAARVPTVFADCAVERYEGRHHLDTSHQAEPHRVATALRRLWDRADSTNPRR